MSDVRHLVRQVTGIDTKEGVQRMRIKAHSEMGKHAIHQCNGWAGVNATQVTMG